MYKLQYGKDLFILTNKLKRLIEKKHQTNGLYIGQARLLTYLYNNKDSKTYQKDIEQAFQIRGGTVSGLIDSLEANNYIIRVDSETDKRKKKVILTDLGEEFALKSIKTILSVEEDISSSLTKEEQRVFETVCNKINKYIDEEENK